MEDFYDSDDDGDGYEDAEEIAYGSDPQDASSVANISPLGLKALTPLSLKENRPIGSLVGIIRAVDTDANDTLMYTLVSGEGDEANALFALDANGVLRSAEVFDLESNASTYSVRVRVRDDSNTGMEQAFSIFLTNEVEDLDGDGVEDFYDLDDDGDGYEDVEELAYGSDPRDASSVANSVPFGLNSPTPLSLSENQPIGSFVGMIGASDVDANDTLTYSLVSGLGDSGNLWFSMDANGTLHSGVVFDFENNASEYPIRVQVSDDSNASSVGIFTVLLTNEVEDLDGDGVEDFYDLDDDGDGFEDVEELAYGSDPMDPSSVANSAPYGLTFMGQLSVRENESVGAEIGVFSAQDDESHALSFSLVFGEGDNGNPWFDLDADGTLRSAFSFDYEENATKYPILVRVTDEKNLYQEKSILVSVLNVVEDVDGDGIEDHFDPEDDRIEVPITNLGPDGLLYELSEQKYNLQEARELALSEGAFIPELTVSSNSGDLDPMTEFLQGFLIKEGGKKSSAWVSGRTVNAFGWATDLILTARRGLRPMRASKRLPVLLGREAPDPGPSQLQFGLSVDRALVLRENQPVGTLIGSFVTPYTEGPEIFTYSFENQPNGFDNEFFSLNSNGTLKSGVTYDYESEPREFKVRVRVTDQQGASLAGTFSVTLLNEIEDMDGDGIEDAHDPDADGDGIDNQMEQSIGTDPFNIDTDSDGLWDRIEIAIGTNPMLEDSDYDGISDLSSVDFLDQLPGEMQGSSELKLPANLGPDGKLYSILKDAIPQLELPDRLRKENLQLAHLSNNLELRKFLLSLMRNEQVSQAWVGQERAQFSNSPYGTQSSEITSYSSTLGVISVKEESIQLPVIVEAEVQLPIVETGKPEYINGALVASSSLIASGGISPFKVGFVVSTRIIGWQQDNETQVFETELTGNEFSRVLEGLPFGERFYLRAFAENSAGINYGTVRKFKTKTMEELFADQGSYYAKPFVGESQSENSWKEDEAFGWMYFGKRDQAGIWFWIEKMGWMWSTQSSWPFCWNQATEGWFYYLGMQNYEPTFFDYGEYGTVTSVPLPDIEKPEVLLPIPRTLEPETENENVWAVAQLMTDGGEEPHEVGFIVSTKITGWKTDLQKIVLSAELQGDFFRVSLHQSLDDGTYYVRSFARNSAGEVVGSVKRFRVEGNYRAPFDAYSVGGLWYRSDWFGLFRKTNFQWIYHQDLEWIYHGPIEPQGIWFWREGIGWLWSNEESWPYLWSHTFSNWYHFSGNIDGLPTVWNFRTSSYEHW